MKTIKVTLTAEMFDFIRRQLRVRVEDMDQTIQDEGSDSSMVAGATSKKRELEAALTAYMSGARGEAMVSCPACGYMGAPDMRMWNEMQDMMERLDERIDDTEAKLKKLGVLK